jgi:WD40 repeat protein
MRYPENTYLSCLNGVFLMPNLKFYWLWINFFCPLALLAQTVAPAPVKSSSNLPALSPELIPQVELLWVQISHENFEQRERAQRRLLEIGPGVLKFLPKTVIAADDQDRTYRIDEISRVLKSQVMCAESEITDHEDRVLSVAFSTDGNLFASAGGGKRMTNEVLEGSDFSIRIWDAVNLQKKFTFEGHSAPVNRVIWSSIAPMLLSASNDGTACLWRIGEQKPWRVFRENDAPISVALLTSDEKFVLTGSRDGYVRAWNVQSGKLMSEIAWHSSPILDMSLSPDGKELAVCGEDTAIRILNLKTGQEQQILKNHRKHVHTVAYAPTGKYLASGGSDGSVRLWNLETAKETRTHSQYSTPIHAVSWSQDGRYLLVAHGDKKIRVLESITGKQARIFSGHDAAVCAVAISPNHRLILSGGEDCSVRLWPTLGLFQP